MTPPTRRLHDEDLSRNFSIIGDWWHSLDKTLLYALFLLAGIGTLFVFSTSPSVAERFDVWTYKFFQKHIIFLLLTFPIMLVVSFLNLRKLQVSSFVLLAASLIGILLTLLIGIENNGAKRWLIFAGHSLQPSEFVKPAFAVVCAWLFSSQRCGQSPIAGLGYIFAIILGVLIVALLWLQPDFGQSLLIIVILFSQMLLIGVPIALCILIGVIIAIPCLSLGYLYIPHVRIRIDNYWDGGDHYQIGRSLETFGSGGFLGRGPIEGVFKKDLPDSHTDFIFAVVGEELGFLLTALFVLLFVYIFLRVMSRARAQNKHFVILACGALTTQLAAQAFINMGSSLEVTPTTGMTLPMVSYGGSSLVAVGISFGLLLGLTRKRIQEQK